MGKSKSRKSRKQMSPAKGNQIKTSHSGTPETSPGSEGSQPPSIEVKEAGEVEEVYNDNNKEYRKNNESNEQVESHNDSTDDDTSIVEPRMVHTEIIEKDNPFMEQHTEEVSKDDEKLNTISERSKNLKNPNNTYEDENEDLLPVSKNSENAQTDSKNDEYSRRSSFKSPDILSDDPSENINTGTQIKVQILEAAKVSEGQGRTFIAYSIKYGETIVKRRYSDFESLRNILVRLFPITLIPPIPKKQSIKNYSKSITGSNSKYLLPSDDTGSVDLSLSIINGSVNNNDEKLIRHRIRMLTQFLNKVLQNEEIVKTTIITDFLDPNNVNWNDFVASSATFASLPKNVLNCNPLDPTNTTRVHACLPVPSSTQLVIPREVSEKDNKVAKMAMKSKDTFQLIEQDFKKYEYLLDNGLYKHNKRITKNLHDLGLDYKDLAELLSDFTGTTDQDAEVAELLSYYSNAFDESSVLLSKLVSRFYYNINEPLNESVGMAGAMRELIKYRRLKFIQMEIIRRTLASKKSQLDKFELQNDESQDIDKVVQEEIAQAPKISFERPETEPTSYSGKLFNRFNKLANIVKETVNYQEIDPRTAVINLKRDVVELEESLKVTQSDLKDISKIIRENELKFFEKGREAELTQIMKRNAKYLRAYAEKNLEVWKNLKRQQSE